MILAQLIGKKTYHYLKRCTQKWDIFDAKFPQPVKKITSGKLIFHAQKCDFPIKINRNM
jgi:hypothetical protein